MIQIDAGFADVRTKELSPLLELPFRGVKEIPARGISKVTYTPKISVMMPERGVCERLKTPVQYTTMC